MILRVRDDEGNIFDIPAIRGLSNYEIAVKNGFEGTEKEWLESIGVEKGDSAYEVAVEEGFEGDVTAWLNSLIGPKGDTGNPATIVEVKVETIGADHEGSATITNKGTEDDPSYILNLKIPKGKDGRDGTNGLPGETGPSVKLEVGDVYSLDSSEDPTVLISGSSPNYTISFGIPKGEKGDSGSGGSSSSDLPHVDSNDNGKFLRVEGGSWTAVSISFAEENAF